MDENWIHSMLLILLGITILFDATQCQKNDGPGVARVYRKTSFSCHGRSNGYYADIETGCQVYHMCDSLGRQFSYSCPNTTLFQQRMLVCDHWYMVNCSRAESDYDANLLIGQRDKPFVPDNEHHLRTPRPDLLDRPYAPDYSGESFRNQYEVQQSLNRIDEPVENVESKSKLQAQLNPPPSSTRWRITVPSRDILPPAPSPIAVAVRRMDEIEETNPDLGTSFSTRYNTSADVSSEEDNISPASIAQQSVSSTTVKSTTRTTPTTTQNNFITRQNSKKVNSSPTFKKTTATTVTAQPTKFSQITKQPIANRISETDIKVPSKLYEPPFLYPIWNENYTESEEIRKYESFSSLSTTIRTTTTTTSTTTARPIQIISSPSAPFSASTRSTPTRPVSPPSIRPTTSSGKPFAQKYKQPTTTASYDFNPDKNSNSLESLQQAESSNRGPSSINNFDFSRLSIKASSSPFSSKAKNQQLNERKAPSTQLLKQKPIVVAPEPEEENQNDNISESIFDYNIPKGQRLETPISFSKPIDRMDVNNINRSAAPKLNSIPSPSRELVPPFPEYIEHDVATTQGPPIYFEWKIPSNALEPPKLDSPIGIDGRQPDYEIEYQKKAQQQGSTDQSQLQEQELPHEQQQLPFEDPSPTFLPDDSHQLQESELDHGSFGEKIPPSAVPPSEKPSTELLPPYTERSDFLNNNFTSTTEQHKQFPFSHNPFLSTLATKSQRSINRSTRLPLSTSSPRPFSTSNKRELVKNDKGKKSPATEVQIQQLKRQLSIPDYLFPLENGRTGYDFSESKNSFQLKIPKNKIDEKSKWYGENPDCPECHPSFARPGSCEPCIKRR